MDQAVKKFTSEGSDARKWIGRIIIAVILGEAIWSLIVSVMNNLVVPWLGDVMGQSSGLPASFTQRPYNYPDLFVSILEVCIAGTMAVILRKGETGEEPGSDRAGRARTSGSSSRDGCREHPGHVADPPTSTTDEARSGYLTCTRPGHSGRAASICLDNETCDGCRPSAANCELCGGKASAGRAKSRATQAEETQRGVLQHSRRTRAFRRRLAAKAESRLP